MSTTRERFLKLSGRRYLPVTIPGFGPLRVRSMNEAERAELEAFKNQPKLVKRVVVALSLCEPDEDRPVFDCSTAEALDLAVAQLALIDGAVINEVAATAFQLNRIEESDVKALLGELAAS